MKQLCAMLIMLCSICYVKGQNLSWATDLSSTSGPCPITDLETDNLGNVYSVGYYSDSARYYSGTAPLFLTSNGLYDIFISKHNSTGTLLWIKTLGSIGTDWATDIKFKNNNELIVCGNFSDSIDLDPGPASNIVSPIGGTNIFTLIIDTSGNYLTSKTYNGSSDIGANALEIDNAGNYYITGDYATDIQFSPSVSLANPTGALFVAKFDQNDNALWARSINATVGNYAYASAINIDPANNVYFTGKFKGQVDFNPNAGVFNLNAGVGPAGPQTTAFIVKLDSAANFIYAKRFTESWAWYGSGMDIEFDANEKTYLLFTMSGYGYGFSHIRKLDPVGQEIWDISLCLTSSGNDPYNDFDVSNDGQIIVGTFDNDPDFISPSIGFISKWDTLGNFHWQQSMSGVFFTRDLEIDQNNDIHFGGSFAYPIDFNPNSPPPYMLTPIVNGLQSGFIAKMNNCSSPYTTIDSTSCDSLIVNGNWYYSDTTFVDFYNNVNGCDSNIVWDIKVLKPSFDSLVVSQCDSAVINGQTFYASGNYAQNFTNSVGCDSILTIQLSIDTSSSQIINSTQCDSATINGMTYYSSGVYTQTLTNANGCDSILTLNLIINPSTTSSISQSACDSTTINGQTYYTSGTYTQTLTNNNGCDSILTLNITISSITANINSNGQHLTATGGIAPTYQWLTCNPFVQIAGANNPTFNVTTNGSYAVAISENGCSDTSSCETFTNVGIVDYQAGLVNTYPNPTTGLLHIETDVSVRDGNLILYNKLGQIILKRNNLNGNNFILNLNELASGIYILELKNSELRTRQRIVKE